MAERNSIDCNSVEGNLNNQQLRLRIINEIKDYFISEIKKRELMSKRLTKHIASLDYFDKSLIVLSATKGSISIASSLSLTFSLSIGLVKKLLKTTRNKKKVK